MYTSWHTLFVFVFVFFQDVVRSDETKQALLPRPVQPHMTEDPGTASEFKDKFRGGKDIKETVVNEFLRWCPKLALAISRIKNLEDFDVSIFPDVGFTTTWDPAKNRNRKKFVFNYARFVFIVTSVETLPD